jgi:CRISPR system Cascade subunit CasA
LHIQTAALSCSTFVLLDIAMKNTGAKPFNLLTYQWLPVRRARAKGAIDWISPAQLTGESEGGPVVAFAWPRPDFDLASHEFMIGLLAVACPPQDERDWLRRFHHLPSQDELAAAFAPYESAFFLDGDGPRFLQDFDEIVGKTLPPGFLFMDSPGDNAIEKNRDLLVKRNRVSVLSRPAAAIALYVVQQFAKADGRGLKTSMRGGGPLVTLTRASGFTTLWQEVWLNVPPAEDLSRVDRRQIFPWLGSIGHLKDRDVSVTDMCEAHAFFGMPRRFRLDFESNDQDRACSITGKVDKAILTGVRRAQGLNYRIFEHYLSPYKAKIEEDKRSSALTSPDYHLGYRDWLGLVYQGRSKFKAARAFVQAKKRLLDLEDDELIGQTLLLCGGYSTKKAAAVAFVEVEMPVHLVRDESLARRLEEFTAILVESTNKVGEMLRFALKIAFYGRKDHKKAVGPLGALPLPEQWRLDAAPKDKDSPILLEAPRERLWTETEEEFHRLLDEAIRALDNKDDEDPGKPLREKWRETLRKTALAIFDDAAPLDAFGEVDPERIVGARKMLALGLKGYGRYGKSFFDELALPLPEGARKPRSKSSGRKKERNEEESA